MSKKITVIGITILVLAFAAGTVMAAESGKNNPDPAVQAVQPTPATDTPVQSAPAGPAGPHYHGAAYYPGWNCGYYHSAGPQNAPVPGYYRSGGGCGCGWGCW